MLLSATWLGLSFANQLVAPIRRLIAATDQVSSGNLYVQVPVHRSEGDLAHLGETFNKMTSDLRLQQNRLIAASHLIDERRVFTEAVLSGVPAAVIGVDARGRLTVLNPSARSSCSRRRSGQRDRAADRRTILPELGADPCRGARGKPAADPKPDGARRATAASASSTSASPPKPSARAEQSLVVTLDDITDLVTAQRTVGLGRCRAAHRP